MVKTLFTLVSYTSYLNSLEMNVFDVTWYR
jgi:hypothetical protein